MTAISNLGYLVIQASDLAAWETFAIETIGLQAGRRIPGKFLALRMDEREQRILVEQGDDDDLVAAGWELSNERDLESFVSHLRQRGIEVAEGDAALTAHRRVEKLYHCLDPDGIRHEFYTGAQLAPMAQAFRSNVMMGGFSTGRLGVGHFVIAAKDARQTSDFCQNVLGVKVSDYIRGELAPGKFLDVSFFHASTGRHHSVATAEIPFPYPKRIHHIMVEVENMNDVGLAYDRCIKAGYAINMHLGHHPNDQMFSFYVHTPSGFLLEFGSGGIVVDDANWEIRSFSQLSDWGHHHPEPEAPSLS